MSRNFDRQYRFSAGSAGGSGIEIGRGNPMALRIAFRIEKNEVQSPNTATISLWNLAPKSLAVLGQPDCAVTLKAGYGGSLPLIFTGDVTYVITEDDGADRKTTIEALDGRVAVRDSYTALSYLQQTGSRSIYEAAAGEIGLPIVFSEEATFTDMPNYSFVGQAKDALTKLCQTDGMEWSIQNGVIQVRRSKEPISRRVQVISPETGLIGSPRPISKGERNSGNAPANSPSNDAQEGWEVDYFLNGAIGVNDYVKLESKEATGFFRVASVILDGDNYKDWLCTAELLEA